jgi:DNA helicase-2/ATP-dependent DNA helicase PcrA
MNAFLNVRPPSLIAAAELRENPGQWAAYESTGNCVVLAGPGSGKTKTLTIKMARMLVEDVRPPRGLACITYSAECARELRRRLQRLGVSESKSVFIGTVHAFCLKNVVVPYAKLGGVQLPYPVAIATQKEQLNHFDDAVRSVLGRSARAAEFRTPIDAYRRTHVDRTSPSWKEYSDFAAVIESYEASLRKSGLIDFDDMVLMGLYLIESFDWVRKAIHPCAISDTCCRRISRSRPTTSQDRVESLL